jgi:hypothetical protein
MGKTAKQPARKRQKAEAGTAAKDKEQVAQLEA